MSTYVPFSKVAKELSMLKILKDCGFEPHATKNSPNSKAKIFQKNSRTFLYYNNASGEYFVDGDNNHIKGDTINLLYELGVVRSTEDLLNYYNSNGKIKHAISQEVFQERKAPTFEELLELFKPAAFKQLGSFNYLNKRHLQQSFLNKYPKDFVAQSPKKFKGTHNIIFNLYHFDKAENKHVLASQMFKNNNFSGGIEDGIKSQSLWLSSFNKNFENVYIFEDPIDALSFEQMHLSKTADTNYLLVATCGNAAKGQYLEMIKHISSNKVQKPHIHYCNDNDYAGRRANVKVFNALNNFYNDLDIRSTFNNNTEEVTLTIDTNKIQSDQITMLKKLSEGLQTDKPGINQYTFILNEHNCNSYFQVFKGLEKGIANELHVPKVDDWNHVLKLNQQQQMEL